MKLSTLISLAAGIVIPLQGATFYYVIEVEHRLTRMETLVERQGVFAPRPRTLQQQSAEEKL